MNRKWALKQTAGLPLTRSCPPKTPELSKQCLLHDKTNAFWIYYNCLSD